MNIYRIIPDIQFGSNCYLLENGGEWAVIDPSCKYGDAIKYYPAMDGNLKYILITHAHFDHIYEIDSWPTEKVEVLVGSGDSSALSDSYLNCYLGFLGIEGGYEGAFTAAYEGDKISLGESIIEVIETPGHTPGGLSFKTEKGIFVGDTIFADGGYGRCDLPGGDIDTLWNSIFKLYSQNMIGTFYPGHGNPDTFENSIKYFN